MRDTRVAHARPTIEGVEQSGTPMRVPMPTGARDTRVAQARPIIEGVEHWLPLPGQQQTTSVRDTRVAQARPIIEGVEHWLPLPGQQQTTSVRDTRVAQARPIIEGVEQSGTPMRAPVPTGVRDTRVAQARPIIEGVEHWLPLPGQQQTTSVRDTRVAQARPFITLDTEFNVPAMATPAYGAGVTRLEQYGATHVRMNALDADTTAAQAMAAPPVTATRDTRFVAQAVHAYGDAGGVMDGPAQTGAAPGAYTHKHMRDTAVAAHTVHSDMHDFTPRQTVAPSFGIAASRNLDAPVLAVRSSMPDAEWAPRAAAAVHEGHVLRNDEFGTHLHVGNDLTSAWDHEGATQPRAMPTFRDVAEVRNTDTRPGQRVGLDAFYIARNEAAQPATYGLGAKSRPYMHPVAHDRPGLITAPLELYRAALDPKLQRYEQAATEMLHARAAAAANPHPTMQSQGDAYESAYESGRD